MTLGFIFSSIAGTCITKNPDWEESYGLRWTCPEGHINDVATLFLSSNHHTITKLFSIVRLVLQLLDGNRLVLHA